MNKITAQKTLLQEAFKNRLSVSGYKRCVRALKALEYNAEDSKTILAFMEYVNETTGEPYQWLAEKLKGK